MEYNSGGGGFPGGGFSGYGGAFGGMDGDAGNLGGGFFEGGGDNKSSEKKVSKDRLSVIPTSIKQLLLAQNKGDSFIYDSTELFTVKLIGLVKSVNIHATNKVFEIDDGSGSIECKKWIDKDTSSGSSEVDIRENSYVVVHGSLRQYENTRNIMIYKIAPLSDWNELTTHLLDVIYAHLQSTRGPLPSTSTAQASGGLSQGQYRGSSAPGGYAPSGYAPTAAGGNRLAGIMPNASGFDDLLIEVIRLCSPPDGAGAQVSDIARALEQRQIRKPLGEIKKSLLGLINNGTAYSGADDDRYCLVD